MKRFVLTLLLGLVARLVKTGKISALAAIVFLAFVFGQLAVGEVTENPGGYAAACACGSDKDPGPKDPGPKDPDPKPEPEPPAPEPETPRPDRLTVENDGEGDDNVVVCTSPKSADALRPRHPDVAEAITHELQRARGSFAQPGIRVIVEDGIVLGFARRDTPRSQVRLAVAVEEGRVCATHPPFFGN